MPARTASPSLTRRALIGAFAGLAGCGFTPVYGPTQPGNALQNSVILDTPASSNGYTLRQQLQDRLGPADHARYRLSVLIQTSTKRVAVTRNQDTNRFNIIGQASFILRTVDGTEVARGEVDSFNGYAATGTTTATLAAERDAYRRLMVILADQIVDRLYLSTPGTAG